MNPQHAATDIVEKLLQLGERRVIREQLGEITAHEFHMITGVKVHWRAANIRQNVAETNQEFCWRVRRFTKGALLNVARQMSQHSSLAWAIVANNREHTIQFLSKKQSNLLPVPSKPKYGLINIDQNFYAFNVQIIRNSRIQKCDGQCQPTSSK